MFLKELTLITSASKCDTCHNWYFLSKGFTFQPNVCEGCHDLFMMCMNLTVIAILNNKVLIITILLVELA